MPAPRSSVRCYTSYIGWKGVLAVAVTVTLGWRGTLFVTTGTDSYLVILPKWIHCPVYF
jgi:hypothetical protein